MVLMHENSHNFTAGASFIDESLRELDELISRKKADLERLDMLRKSRSPYSFRIMSSEPRKSPSSNIEAASASAHLSPAKSPMPSKSPVSVNWMDCDLIEVEQDKENTPANHTIDLSASQHKSPAEQPLQPHKSPKKAQSPAPMTQQQPQQQTKARTPLPTMAQHPSSSHALTPMYAEHADCSHSRVVQTPQSVQKLADDQLVIDSISKALRRIEELELNRKDYALYIQRLTSEKEEMLLVLDAQKAVIDVLTTTTQKMKEQQLDESQQQLEGGGEETRIDMSDMLSMSSPTSSANKRRLVQRRAPASVSLSGRGRPLDSPHGSTTSSSSPFGASMSPVHAAQETQMHESPSIYIFRQPPTPEQVMSPAMHNMSGAVVPKTTQLDSSRNNQHYYSDAVEIIDDELTSEGLVKVLVAFIVFLLACPLV